MLNRSYANRAQTQDDKGFYLDSAGRFNSFAAKDGILRNRGAQERLARFAEILPDQSVTPTPADPLINWKDKDGTGVFIGSLGTELGTMPFGVLPGQQVNLSCIMNTPEFFLMADPEAIKQRPAFEITSIQVLNLERTLPPDAFIRYSFAIRISPPLKIVLPSTLILTRFSITRPLTEGRSALQSFMQMRLTAIPVPQGGVTFTVENFLNSSDLGVKVIFAFVSTEALEGSFSKSPFYWPKIFKGPTPERPCKINEVILSLDGAHADGLRLSGASYEMNERLLYTRFNRFSGVSQSNVFSSGIGYRDYVSDGGWAFSPLIHVRRSTHYRSISFSAFSLSFTISLQVLMRTSKRSCHVREAAEQGLKSRSPSP